jgi:hypothetical protein
MNFMNEYGLLVAVALPVLAIVGIQVFLFIGGERDTLLIPGLDRYPSIELGKSSATVTPMPVVDTAKVTATVESSNDEEERIAA